MTLERLVGPSRHGRREDGGGGGRILKCGEGCLGPANERTDVFNIYSKQGRSDWALTIIATAETIMCQA